MASIILKNAFVYTMDDNNSTAEAVAIEGKKIIAVGSESDVMAMKNNETKVIDLAGKMILPGFIDAHCHPAFAAYVEDGIVIDEEMDIPELEACIAEFIAENPDKKAYFGLGYNECLYDEKGPKKEDLDKICADKAVLILGSGGHEGWCNTKALELAGIDKNTPDPDPGFQYFERDEEGNPTGHLVENGSIRMISGKGDYFDPESIGNRLIEVSKSYSEMGVTGLVMCGDFDWMENTSIPLTERLVNEGKLQQRLQGCVLATDKDKFDYYMDELERRSKKYDTDEYRVNVYKTILDGTLESRTACMLEPYNEDGRIIKPLFSGEELQKNCLEVASRGFDIHIHAIGDWASKEILGAAKAVREAGYMDTRIIDAHTQCVAPEERPLFAKYNVTANTTGVWHYGNPDMDKVIGKERADSMFTMKDIIDAGGRISLGSDRPVDEYGPEPLKSIEVAVTRKLYDSHDCPVLKPENQKLTVQQCLEGFTKNVAYQMHMEDKIGTIEVGKYADLVVLGENIFDVDETQIHNIPIDMTIANGRIVYKK